MALVSSGFAFFGVSYPNPSTPPLPLSFLCLSPCFSLSLSPFSLSPSLSFICLSLSPSLSVCLSYTHTHTQLPNLGGPYLPLRYSVLSPLGLVGIYNR